MHPCRSGSMRKFTPVFWPVPVFYRDELKPRRKYFLWGERSQGSRAASNFGFWIVAKKGIPSHILEQEKFESRYWVTHFWRLIDFPLFMWFGSTRAARHLARVECASRAQEIRARLAVPIPGSSWLTLVDPRFICEVLAREYAGAIHDAKQYRFFAAAGWDEERIYQEITGEL